VSARAIEVSTSVKIDHWELGRHFFDWDNTEQARFLHGMRIGLDELKADGKMQLLYIVDAAKAGKTCDEIPGLVELLHEYLGEIG
jgi:hypothetical protein